MADNKIVIITWVSGSWKTTLHEMLKKRDGFNCPLHYTTRKPRNDKELDEYVFLTNEQFLTKLQNGDFSEHTVYNGNFYALSAHFDTQAKTAVILEPVGKWEFEKYCRVNWIKTLSIFLDIDEKKMEERLWMNRGESVQTIEQRKKDFLYFIPEGYDYVIDASWTAEETYNHVSHILKTNGVL